LNRQGGFSALLFELGIGELVAFAHASDFAEAPVFVTNQRSHERRVRFRHQDDSHFSRVRSQVPLRNFD